MTFAFFSVDVHEFESYFQTQTTMTFTLSPRRATAMLAAAFGLVVTLVAGTGCARRMPPMVTTADAQRTHVQMADLEAGRTVLIRKCGGCHQPPLPTDHTAADWPSKLDEMSSRANLDTRERRVIQQYLVAMSR
jgi:cytochrome c5